MGAMHNVMIGEEWIEENKNLDKKGDECIVIEKQVVNVIINFTLDGMEYRVEK